MLTSKSYDIQKEREGLIWSQVWTPPTHYGVA